MNLTSSAAPKIPVQNRTSSIVRTVVIAEDHALVRAGFRELLKNHPSFEVVGEATDGWETVQVVSARRPDVLLLDLCLPRLHGNEVIQHVKGKVQFILVISMQSDSAVILEALRNGADGYLTKDSAPDELINALRAITAGDYYLTDSLRKKVNTDCLSQLFARSTEPRMTCRERRVFELAVKGGTSRAIAACLSLSRRTVEAHRANLMKKLSLRNQTELALYGIRCGAISA